MTEIASLGLEIVPKGIRDSTDQLKKLTAEAKISERAAASLRRVWQVGLAGLAAGAAAFSFGVGAAVRRMEDMERMSRMVDVALRNSGNSARTSAREIEAWADLLEVRTGRAAEEVMSVATNLASFGFGRSEFFRAMELANDMAAAWGGDLRQNLEGLARAIDDPLNGMAMLSRRGIQLTQDQKDLAAAFLDSNDKISAQGVVFEALEAQVKGVAEEGYGGLTKAWNLARKAWDDAFESMVRGEGQAGDLRQSLIGLAQAVSSPQLIGAVTQFGTVFVNVLRAIADGAANAANNLRLITDFFASTRGDLEGLSYQGLEEKMRQIGLQRLDLDNQIREAQNRLSQGGAATLFGINNGALEGSIVQAKAQMQELADQERQILTMLYARDQAGKMAGPAPGTMEGFGFVNPYEGQTFTTDATAKAAAAASGRYADLVRGAQAFISAQNLERQAVGMTAEAANALRYEHQLLNEAMAAGISLSPAQQAQLGGLALQMATAEQQARSLAEAYDFGRQTFGSFMSDLRQGLMNGSSLWESFGNAGATALDRIADRALSMAADGIFDMIFGSIFGGPAGNVSGVTKQIELRNAS